jgi:hypothetical protein
MNEYTKHGVLSLHHDNLVCYAVSVTHLAHQARDLQAQIVSERRPHLTYAGHSAATGALLDRNVGIEAVASFLMLSSYFKTCSYRVYVVLQLAIASSN